MLKTLLLASAACASSSSLIRVRLRMSTMLSRAIDELEAGVRGLHRVLMENLRVQRSNDIKAKF